MGSGNTHDALLRGRRERVNRPAGWPPPLPMTWKAPEDRAAPSSRLRPSSSGPPVPGAAGEVPCYFRLLAGAREASNVAFRAGWPWADKLPLRTSPMRQTGPGPTTTLPHPAPRPAPAPRSEAGAFWARAGAWAAAALAGALLAAAVLLWARYGATVFFDTLAAGIAACF